ncbi:branched-chain amino acid transport system II carrier protein [Rothia sp. BD8]|uniref:branched-chain amino acid transport system II carrier protein n=1 Tax=Rothia sp. BD8 TaxID=2953894 RepID=UPI003841147E
MTNAPEAAPGRPRRTERTGVVIVVAAMMLFSMFFGAGNLIFPPILGASSGESFVPAVLGFLSSGVLLPVLAVLAIAITGRDVQDLASRGGRVFGVIFPVLIYLSIGAFYALPRTATVSFSTTITPNFGWDSWGATALFSAVFFLITLALAFDPRNIVDALGKFLTPALIILLVIMVVLGIANLHSDPGAATEEYASHPYSAGFLEGYLTMDSLAALAFGIVVVSALRQKGVPTGPALVRGVSLSGIIAGALLAVVYVGLGVIGHRIPDAAGYPDGASLLSAAAAQTMGRPGAWVFGLIVLLACLTTSVGLLGATSEFFAKLVPAISYRWWAVIFTIIAFLVSTLGLSTVIAIAGPIVGFLYPAAITLIFLTLVEPLLRRRLNLTYVFSLTVAIIWSALMSADSLGWVSSWIEPLIGWAPGYEQELGWFFPTLAAAIVGYIIDLSRGAKKAVPVGGETKAEAEDRVLG